MSEHRKADRQSKRVTVKYGKEQVEHLGFTKNVSPTGLRLEGRHVFPKGTILQLVYGEPAVTRSGRVMWVKTVPPTLMMAGTMPTMGIKFEGAAPPQAPAGTPPATAR